MTTTLPAGWKPISSAPKDGTGILGYWDTGTIHDCNFSAVKFHRGAWWETNEDYKVSQPTHWMPLPAAPGTPPASAQPERDWELTCDGCDGDGFVYVERRVGPCATDIQTFKEDCDCCEGRGFVFAFQDIPGIEEYVKACRPATTQDDPITVSLDPDSRGVSVGVWQGSRCIYTGAHAVPVSAQDDAKDERSDTYGMNLGERIAHVGGRTNAQGYTEFGSPMAVNALIQHVLRDIDWTRQDDDGAYQARYRLPGGQWSTWGHVVCGVKGHEQELRYLPGERRPAPAAGDALAWQGLTKAELASYVGAIIDYGTEFVSPLYSVVEDIEKRLREKNAALAAQVPHKGDAA